MDVSMLVNNIVVPPGGEKHEEQGHTYRSVQECLPPMTIPTTIILFRTSRIY